MVASFLAFALIDCYRYAHVAVAEQGGHLVRRLVGDVAVREGAGCMLGLDALAPTGPGTGLEFRPLWPPVVAHIDFAWRRGQKLSNAASMFLEDFKAAL